MGKKNEKKLCWNCDGNVPISLDQCPYCGTDLTKKPDLQETTPSLQGPAYLGHSFQRSLQEDSIPKSPYGNLAVSEEEWNQTLESEQIEAKEENEDGHPSKGKSEMIALLLLLPGVVFFLFGLILLLFSDNGVLTLQWNQSFAYFYFLGALPLLILGWKALR